MTYKFEQGKREIINSVKTLIEKKLKNKEAKNCCIFVEEFFSTVATDDLKTHSTEDLYGLALSFWKFMFKRSPGETKIRVYNPDFEKHGWQSTHTIIEIVQDDMPFIVDSVRMEVDRLGYTPHLIVNLGGFVVKRDKNHEITDVIAEHGSSAKGQYDAPLLIEINRQTDESELHELVNNIRRVLGDVQATVKDWRAMRQKVKDSIQSLNKVKSKLDSDELAETCDFLQWIEDHHFTFLGVRDYDLVEEDGEKVLRVKPNTGLGVLSDSSESKVSRSIASMTPEARKLTLSQQMLIISKTNTLSTVHRPVYTDYIGVKCFDAQGNVTGERRFIGLYTSAAYNTNPMAIPFLRRKVKQVMQHSRLSHKSHAWKIFYNLLETLPRDDLLQAPAEELLETTMGIFHIQERRRIKFFCRKDVYGRFFSCLVFVPRERFNTELREAMQDVLAKAFNATEINFKTRFSDSVLARIHFDIRIDSKNIPEYDVKKIENDLVAIARSWPDELTEVLLESFGEEKGNRLLNKYRHAFPASYLEDFVPRNAVYDIRHIIQLKTDCSVALNFYRPAHEINGALRFKIYRPAETIPLSDVLPILEDMGLRVISEKPYQIQDSDGRCTWINDFSMEYTGAKPLNIDKVRDKFEAAFERIWYNEVNSDRFNYLVLSAMLSWREVNIIRAYSRYLRQTGFTFSQDYIEETFTLHPEIATKLVHYFLSKFDPNSAKKAEQKCQALEEAIIKDLDNVANLDEDRIIRRFLAVIKATLRTNYFQQINGSFKKYLSFKLNSALVPELPLPKPMFEIFVYSPRFEGIHLRGAKVARGGLRWSDRREDFRTEVLGLMKAQQVKNAVIVPSGAKGGFVPKYLPVDGSREEIMAEGIACYQNFIRGLLDITDNLVDEKIVHPENVVRYDEDDPYLVVAADKGTATFSDIANEISADYNFWLGDAFASGGSMGYDHKKMGITARGAWESVKRHFRELGRDIQNEEFTVAGVGDMSGDVFGNGMLLSKHIRLTAAFNHMHIFLDPNPDAAKSFEERQRLFNLPRSSWTDYNKDLISKGGGIFNRSAKSIKLTPEIKQLLDLKQDIIEPNELLKAILRAKVDLLWFGGIGTYLKAPTETHLDAGDRANDALRINSDELRCTVVGEGANLGVTQMARVDYALNGGLIFTDFIDNSAGVNCSDSEVNIKILLNKIVTDGDLTIKQRNALLAKMTDEVSELVLHNNYRQTQAISLAAAQSLQNLELHSRYIADLEATGKLERQLEFLPDEKALMERKLRGKGLARPGIAVLLAYSKTILKQQILDSDLPEDPYLSNTLETAFPAPLRKRFRAQMDGHSLRREIIATSLANSLVNEMGFTFVYRLADETGAPPAAIVRAYTVAKSVYDIDTIWNSINALDNKVPAATQTAMLMVVIRMLRRITGWVLRNKRMHLDIATAVSSYQKAVFNLKNCVPDLLSGIDRKNYDTVFKSFTSQGVPDEVSHSVARMNVLSTAFDIVDVATEYKTSLLCVAKIYFSLGDILDLGWVRAQAIAHPVENHWEALSREAIRNDLDWQQRMLTTAILKLGIDDEDEPEHCIQHWMEHFKMLIARWEHMLADLRSSTALNFTMLFVAVRELLDLTQTSLQTEVKGFKTAKVEPESSEKKTNKKKSA